MCVLINPTQKHTYKNSVLGIGLKKQAEYDTIESKSDPFISENSSCNIEGQIELSEDEAAILNRKFQILTQKLNEDEERPQIKVCYFVPDEHKDGGAYITKIGTVKQIDEVFFKLLLTDGTEIDISDLIDFEIT